MPVIASAMVTLVASWAHAEAGGWLMASPAMVLSDALPPATADSPVWDTSRGGSLTQPGATKYSLTNLYEQLAFF